MAPILKEILEKKTTSSETHNDTRGCSSNADNSTQNTNTTLKVGTIVDDKIPPEQIRLIEVPLKQSHLSLNLSDVSFETMGDKVGDSLDMCKKKVYTGKAAADLIETLQHQNVTMDDE